MRYLLIIISLFLCTGISFANDDQYLFNELTRLAKSGNPEAQYHLGMLYNNGIGTQKDISKALKWFEKSASSGDPLGYYKLGCYYSGQAKGVVITDHKRALEYKLIAAEAGYVRAQDEVATVYYHNKEIDKAIMWWKRAANQGYPDAVYTLVAIYSDGKVIPRDAAMAYGYLKIIEKNIGEDNKYTIDKKLQELQSELSPSQLEQARNFATNWRAKKTDLTIKAFSGINEIWKIIENSVGK